MTLNVDGTNILLTLLLHNMDVDWKDCLFYNPSCGGTLLLKISEKIAGAEGGNKVNVWKET